MVCKFYCWRAENSGVGSTGKFVMRSADCQLTAVKNHHASGVHD